MKPPPFSYHAPTSLDEALDVLARVGADGKVLAGGQSLIPLMNMRLAAPRHLVDINRIEELDTIAVTADGVRVGAGVRHARLEHDAEAHAACPLLRQALGFVAHTVIRNRGTTCGSIAHADPAGEMTGVLALLGGSVRVASATGGEARRREVTAEDFFLGPLESSLQPGELVESVLFPGTPASTGTAFVEVARRHGDYALCGAGALVDLDVHSRITVARVALISVGPTPVVVDVGESLAGTRVVDADFGGAARRLQDLVEPEADIHASAEYRRHLAGVLAGRALQAAAQRSANALHAGAASAARSG